MKYFVFSIDDGTIFDEKVLAIFNKHKIHATFNLNSGMDDYVWYNEGREVRRFILKDKCHLYKGHEIASHSLTHPHLSEAEDKKVYLEAYEDICNLERIFNTKVTTFAFPFEDYDERCINIIKRIKNISIIRISEIDRSFKLPNDPYHLKITSWDIDDALEIIEEFKKDSEAELFVFVAHAYDFEFADSYDELDKLCSIVKKDKNIKVIPMCDVVKLL